MELFVLINPFSYLRKELFLHLLSFCLELSNLYNPSVGFLKVVDHSPRFELLLLVGVTDRHDELYSVLVIPGHPELQETPTVHCLEFVDCLDDNDDVPLVADLCARS